MRNRWGRAGRPTNPTFRLTNAALQRRETRRTLLHQPQQWPTLAAGIELRSRSPGEPRSASISSQSARNSASPIRCRRILTSRMATDTRCAELGFTARQKPRAARLEHFENRAQSFVRGHNRCSLLPPAARARTASHSPGKPRHQTRVAHGVLNMQAVPADIPISVPHFAHPPIRPHGENRSQNLAQPTRRGCGPHRDFAKFSTWKGFVCICQQRAFLQRNASACFRGLADWDAARVFLEVARSGSFRSAAERLGLSINAVRRRIDDSKSRPDRRCSCATSMARI